MINYKLYWNRLAGQNGAQATNAYGTHKTYGAYGANGTNETNETNGLRGALSFIISLLSFFILHFSLFIFMSCPFSVQAQDIVIGGYVYGGGNQGKVNGNTTVRVEEGDIDRVYGGARMADVGGRTFLKIKSTTSTAILINQAFGGNDISGHIGTYNGDMALLDTVPQELVHVKRVAEDATDPKKNTINKTWNTFVQIEGNDGAITETDGNTKNALLIGALYAGGNGNYFYKEYGGRHNIYNSESDFESAPEQPIAFNNTGFDRPEVGKAYLEIVGGSIGQAFGGGNNATVTEKTVIYVENPTKVVNSIKRNHVDISNTAERAAKMDYNPGYTYMSSDAFQIGNFFGGNNHAEMAIRPTWNLQHGKIRNLYSGGNKGAMTSPEGLLVDINPYIPDGSTDEKAAEINNGLVIDNVYGGCRMADVKPTVNGVYTPTVTLPGYQFPNELSARVLVRGGDVNNVYGGNDITGTVYGGNAIGIYTSIRGDVYGGGNGAYPYTDRSSMLEDRTYSDFYYDANSATSSVEALNAFRPNAEQVSIRLWGKDYRHPTIIHGSVFVGGNCATLRTTKPNPLIELKIGSNVMADKVFMGNNGAGMVREDILERYADDNFSGIDLRNANTFAIYMEGVAMPHQPNVVFDAKPNDPDDYADNSSYFGSFYLGGNVGSMTIPGKNTYSISRGLNIFEKFVGGCNESYVPEGTYNAAYDGGVIGSLEERYVDGVISTDRRKDFVDNEGKIKDRLEINFENLTISPMRWQETFTLVPESNLIAGRTYYTSDGSVYNSFVADGTEDIDGDPDYYELIGRNYVKMVPNKLTAGQEYYSTNLRSSKFIATGEEVIDNTAGKEKQQYYVVTSLANDLTWNTAKWSDAKGDFIGVDYTANDPDGRLLDGNTYGGCYQSGHVNGNVIINVNERMLKKDEVFGDGEGIYGYPRSNVTFEDQRDDLLAVALTVFGAGYGEKTEVWGSTTVNLNKGYCFQAFGGGEQGIVGKKKMDDYGVPVLDEHGDFIYEYNPAYSSTVNLRGAPVASDNDSPVANLAETEYIYGGGNEGDVCGNTYVNLGNGRIYDAFGGASDADILGHTEVIIGRQPKADGTFQSGFPWVRDIVYGGNDFGGTIWGGLDDDGELVGYEDGYDFTKRVQNYATVKDQLHGYDSSNPDAIPDVLKSSSYVEYLQGRVDTIYGGNYGFYDYSLEKYLDDNGQQSAKPKLTSSFVNIRPNTNSNNAITGIFGGGTGYPKQRDGDESQDRSYVLIDIPEGIANFQETEIFGSGSFNGLGMRFDIATTFGGSFNRDRFSAIIDLLHGQVGYAYGGSFNEGVTARTVVNVPSASTINIKNIFGGSYGTQILPPCDVIQSVVNYSSDDARVTGNIYGGNNNERRTLFTQVNISSPVWSNKESGYLARVYGAGHGIDTWAEHTQVNLLSGAKVYEAYGGGEMGHVLNAESIQQYMNLYKDKPSPQISAQDPKWSDPARWMGDVGASDLKAAYLDEWDEDWKDAWKLGKYYTPNATYNNYFESFAAFTNSSLVRKAEIDERDFSDYSDEEKAKRYKIFNTNVIINEGAEVVNYAYGGGYGTAAEERSGDVYGHTYIALLGGSVKKDIYAAGTAGAVNDIFGVGPYNASTNTTGFTASTTAYIKGGTCRNVYGGGWLGNVGTHHGDISDSPASDIAGETHVVIGDLAGTSFVNGIPAIQRNAYGGGEGGAVFGTAYLTLNNGYIGYQYNAGGTDDDKTKDIDEHYVEKVEDDTKATPNTLLTEAGCVFGGGYIDNSSVDKTFVNIFGGHVRNSAFGGGEVAAIGRGDMELKAGSTTDYKLKGIYRPGKTNIEMYGGHVHRNVYGGGRGYDNLGGIGSLHNDGFIFGQTEVHIHGGEIGTKAGVADGDGNVFGGCDVGLVFSAYEKSDGSFGKGVKDGVRYDPLYQGYYYQHDWADNGAFVTVTIDKDGDGEPDEDKEGNTIYERLFTEDCKVLIEPHLKVKMAVNINGHEYAVGDYVPIEDLNMLRNKQTDAAKWNSLDQTGIIIHNAVFAGGNAPSGSTSTGANTNTVFGNATASINDIFHRDMITLGTRHTGGLYGDGNLTLVDGYRELNITNYGTDYHSIAKEITIDEYHALPEREAAYYELNYTCLATCTDKLGTTYNPAAEGQKATTITADDMLELFLEKVGDTYVSIRNDASGNHVTSGGNPVLVWDEGEHEWKPNTAPGTGFWKESGVLPVYAGRLMNSIQRADFCGVFGSRMVMQGAQDRVPDEVDYTNYTINRVREVSLNKMDSKITSDLAIAEGSDEYYKKHTHGNYFGIYNVVNYLGALTSDVHFTDTRVTDNTNKDLYGPEIVRDGNGVPLYEESDSQYYKGDDLTYYDWKKKHIKDKTRNNGNSHNKVALASGVYLEITTEESTGNGLYEKVWGPITGVVELDLINVATGIGGGFVYAKNVHGTPSTTGHENTTLTALNEDAVTKWDYDYSTIENESNQKEWETSGNFVHSTQTIIDDCYNISNRYMGEGKMPAHFWYIKGTTYVYDQYISAYTGQANAYSEISDIPLTIAAASHGKLKLQNVMPNRYAYYAKPGEALGDGKKMIVNGKTYYKNDPISYWDWYLLSNYEKELFVEKTYVNCVSVNIDDETADGKRKIYEPGTLIMTDTEYATYKAKEGGHTYKDADGLTIEKADKTAADDDYIFRESNNVSHGEGYILTYEVNNPAIWDNWYTPKSNTTEGGKITLAAYEALVASDASKKALYEDGPTYHLKPELLGESTGKVLGQREYKNGDLIPKDVYTTYESIESHITESNGAQATFVPAYIVTNKITISGATQDSYYNPGTAVPESFYNEHQSDCEVAYICTKTIHVTKEDVIYKNSKMGKSEVDDYIDDVNDKIKDLGINDADDIQQSEIDDLSADNKKLLNQLQTLKSDLQTYLVQAYYCTSKAPSEEGYEGPYYYGGNYYEAGHNYRGLEAWSSMSETDRNQFTFNYDALDLLIDPAYSNAEDQKYQYDGQGFTSEEQAKTNKAGYSVTQSVDYTAEYNSNTNSPTLTNTVTIKRNGGTTTTNVLQKGDELNRDEFETKLVNEQRHYAPVAATNATEEIVNGVSTGKYLAYVVHTPFQIGSTPYAVGETIGSDTYKSLPETEQGYVTTLKFSSTDHSSEAVYYYCRENYTKGANVTVISTETIPGAGGGVTDDGTVQLGTLISSANYTQLPNEQKNFTIHGVSPTETSTLYVSSESDIYDLSKEKIITVIYKYDYDEMDESGNVVPMSERHVLNIHLNFKSGVPTVEDITPPEIILPGDFTSLREPNVTPGAYEVTGGGWELFATKREAESHINGVEYNPTFDPLYWYQDDYYVAYYAKSYLGRTYSNAVPVSVANYHDMKKVMDAKEHHYYIDHKNVKRDSKIYINDYSKSKENGLDLFKNLYDLSVLSSPTVDEDGLITDVGNFTGHHTLNDRVHAGRNLEFFMRTDIDHGPTTEPNPDYDSEDPESPTTITVNHPWTPIGSTSADCFDGVLHGDGHTLSGLDHSLFNHLCGEVYNLGVMGSFNGAGIAETGGGYVESCWVKTSNETPLVSKPNAVFGNPSDETGYQLVNSYFWNGNKDLYANIAGDDPDVLDDEEIITSGGDRGVATAKSAKAFYNGELAYDLNNFYLYKRYSDKMTTSGNDKQKYNYFTIGEDNKLELQKDHFYAQREDLCSTGYVDNESNVIKYVENRFADGDYRFAAGVIAEEEDERHWERKVTVDDKEQIVDEYSPIWPDDYIFFGQKLTYGYNSHDHQAVPTAVARDNGRLSQGDDANRVYRAPAYFRSKDMGTYHFNPTAYLAYKSFDGTQQVTEKSMTAIDFAGHNATNEVDGTYALGRAAAAGGRPQTFYPPLLDDDGLISIKNCDETKNLLVYAPAETGESGYVNAQTHSVLTSYFVDPDYADYYSNDKYRSVGKYTGAINGHLVQSNLKATDDHLLVDKQDFNAPISYQFADGKRMWYQRYPDDEEFVDFTKGWQGISLPFTAELVTTDDKGEITHFYNGSDDHVRQNGDDQESIKGGTSKVGHEYWLRQLDKVEEKTKTEDETTIYYAQADFNYPTATGADAEKEVKNTFLWDYYYSISSGQDKNKDIYQKYYKKARTYDNYPLMGKATPYLIGFPGQNYYEFDLSGAFKAEDTYSDIARLDKQTITFASDDAVTIGVSDDEITAVTKSTTGTNKNFSFTFVPSYMNEVLDNGNYVMNSDGDAYYQLSDVPESYTYDDGKTYTEVEFAAAGTLYSDQAGTVATTWVNGSTTYYKRTGVIPSKNEQNHVTPSLSAFRPYFTATATAKKAGVKQMLMPEYILFSSTQGTEEQEPESALNGSIDIYSRGLKIYTTSHMKTPTTVRIIGLNGITITNYVLEPGKTIETSVNAPGVYIVNQKKLSVR